MSRRRTEPARDRGGLGCGELLSACHVIPYLLDNFLQLFVEDLSVLNWPTLLPEADPMMGSVAEALAGARVEVESDPRMALLRPFPPGALGPAYMQHATGATWPMLPRWCHRADYVEDAAMSLLVIKVAESFCGELCVLE